MSEEELRRKKLKFYTLEFETLKKQIKEEQKKLRFYLLKLKTVVDQIEKLGKESEEK